MKTQKIRCFHVLLAWLSKFYSRFDVAAYNLKHKSLSSPNLSKTQTRRCNQSWWRERSDFLVGQEGCKVICQALTRTRIYWKHSGKKLASSPGRLKQKARQMSTHQGDISPPDKWRVLLAQSHQLCCHGKLSHGWSHLLFYYVWLSGPIWDLHCYYLFIYYNINCRSCLTMIWITRGQELFSMIKDALTPWISDWFTLRADLPFVYG